LRLCVQKAVSRKAAKNAKEEKQDKNSYRVIWVKEADYSIKAKLLQSPPPLVIISLLMAEQTLDNLLEQDDDAEEAERDLGFGSVVTGQSRQRLLNADGTFNVQRTGLAAITSLNLYHTLLTMKWRTFLLLVLLLYL